MRLSALVSCAHVFITHFIKHKAATHLGNLVMIEHAHRFAWTGCSMVDTATIQPASAYCLWHADALVDYKLSLRPGLEGNERKQVLHECHQRGADRLLQLCFAN